MRILHTQPWKPNLKIADRANGSDGFTFNIPPPRPYPREWDEGDSDRSSNESKIINFPLYRRQRPSRYFGIADRERSRNFRRLAVSARNTGFDENYAERMKVNAAIFVFFVFFVLSGIWLMDGLRQAFGR